MGLGVVNEQVETPIRIWIAAYTGPNAEIGVRDAVTSRGYPVLVPTAMTEMRHARQTMLVDRPVFPRYAFIGIPEDKSWYPLKTITGVSGILCIQGKPRPVPDKLIRLLRAAMDEDAFNAAAEPAYRPGQRVEVMVGQTSVSAFVERINNTLPAQRIDVMFRMFGKEHRRTVPVDQVRAA
jgi:transcription antitermination factor NusG